MHKIVRDLTKFKLRNELSSKMYLEILDPLAKKINVQINNFDCIFQKDNIYFFSQDNVSGDQKLFLCELIQG